MAQQTIREAVLENALRLRHAGKFSDAVELYRSILRENPKDFEALHALGMVHYLCGQIEEAERLIGLAIEERPEAAQALYNRACLLKTLRRFDEALSCFGKAIELNPGYVEALINRGDTLLMLNRPQEALLDFECVARARANIFEAWSGRASALMALKRPGDALASIERALAIQSNIAPAWKHRASVLLVLGRPQEALSSLDRALTLAPSDSDALLRKADTLLAMTRFAEAAAAYAKYLVLRSEDAAAWNHRGVALVELKKLDEALACFTRTIALDERNPDAWTNRGNVLSEKKRYAEAARDYERALKLAPFIPYVTGYLAQCRLRSCDWSCLERDRVELTAGIALGKPVIDPMGNLMISRSPADQLDCARIFTADEVQPPPLWNGKVYRHKRLRVAYLSADFRPHAMAFLCAGVFEHHDRNSFETIGVSLGPGEGTGIRTRIEKGCDRFIDVQHMSDSDVAKMLREMEVDIAVDLMGFTDGCRLAILARRPAPVQVNFLGYPGTMGVPYLDYIIADPVLIPEEERRFYSEQVVYLPDTYQANDSKRSIAETTPTRAEVGLPGHGFVFCCFNNNHKITPDVFDVWMRLLRDVEGSVLWLLEDHDSVVPNLKREAETRGISPGRLIFAPRASPADHLVRQRLADLFLDTLPYGAHTTASDALWVGLPVLSCRGTTFAGRVAASLLQAIGLPELITRSMEDYEALARTLARTPSALAEVKAKLLRNRKTHPLFDTARFTRHLERAFTIMVERQRKGERYASFAVSPEPTQ